MDEMTVEEEKEAQGYQIMAGCLLMMAMFAVVCGTDFIWYYKSLFIAASIPYFMGYCRCYDTTYVWAMQDHQMRHDAGYRMTDGHLSAFLFSFGWPVVMPIMWTARMVFRRFMKV